MSNFTENRQSERGSARFKMTLVLVFLFLFAHAAYNYVPTAYDAENFKQEMHTAVVQGVALPGSSLTATDTIKMKLRRAAVNNNVPSDAVIDVKPLNNIVQARVSYNRSINILPFGIYKYNYQFDNTATPTGFLFED